MTTSALTELDTVLKLFEDGALHSPAVANFLVSQPFTTPFRAHLSTCIIPGLDPQSPP
jgi:hypothetical protein